MIEFTYKALPWNIVFGVGALSRLPVELDKLGLSRALVLTTPNQRQDGEELMALLGDRAVGIFDQAAMHVPAETLAAAQKMATSVNADSTISLGGGSTTGLGKALVIKANLENIAIPTSYAGSEMTDIWAITENERKVTARDARVVPTLTLYDPELTLSLPAEFAVSSGLNALAQAVVNVATDKPSPIVSCLALDGVRALVSALPKLQVDGGDMIARSEALYGASMAGGALGTGSTGIHHKLCHTFGGTFNTPHAETHAILLPHSIAYNSMAAAEGTRKVAEVFGAEDAAIGVYDFAKSLGAPCSLQEIGIKEADLDLAASVTTEREFLNPEPVTRTRVRALLQRAWEGSQPVFIAP